jgi:hypothetical protein
MERREFLKFAVGLAAGTAALATAAQAAPLMVRPLTGDDRLSPGKQNVRPAVSSEEELKQLKPQEVRWGHGHGHHWGWRHRHWGWRRRHWGWRHRHWRHRHWRHRYW